MFYVDNASRLKMPKKYSKKDSSKEGSEENENENSKFCIRISNISYHFFKNFN